MRASSLGSSGFVKRRLSNSREVRSEDVTERRNDGSASAEKVGSAVRSYMPEAAEMRGGCREERVGSGRGAGSLGGGMERRMSDSTLDMFFDTRSERGAEESTELLPASVAAK